MSTEMGKEKMSDEENIVEDTMQEEIDEQEVEDVLNGNVNETNDTLALLFKEHKTKIMGFIAVIACILVAITISVSQSNKDVDLAALEWSYDDAKIEELKTTLIDGVSIESLYQETYVYNWSYAFSDGNEYLKVETEDSLDIYNTTDGELEDSLDLLEMKKNFVGKQGLYKGEMAEIVVEIDEEYNVIAYLEIVEEEIQEDVEEDTAVSSEVSEEVVSDLTTDEVLEEIVETPSVEDVMIEVPNIEEEMVEPEISDEGAMMFGKIVSTTEVDFTLETGELVKVEWDEIGEVFFVLPEESFLETTLEIRPMVSAALMEQEYTYVVPEDSEEDLEDEEATDQSEDAVIEPSVETTYNGDYTVEIKSKKSKEIVFNVILEGSENDVLVSDGVAYKQDNSTLYVFNDNGIEICFEQLESEELLITGYDIDKNMIIRVEQ